MEGGGKRGRNGRKRRLGSIGNRRRVRKSTILEVFVMFLNYMIVFQKGY